MADSLEVFARATIEIFHHFPILRVLRGLTSERLGEGQGLPVSVSTRVRLPLQAWGISSDLRWPAEPVLNRGQGLEGNTCFYFQRSWGVGQ